MPTAPARFENVLSLQVAARIGTPGTEGVVKEFDYQTLRDGVHCPNPECKNGGFDLRSEIANRVVGRARSDGTGIVRCRGFESAGSRRTSCSYVMAYSVRVRYAQ